MELYKIINARKTLDDLATQDVDLHLSYWMTKFMVATQKEQDFYQSHLKGIIDKYAVAGENNSLKVAPENIDAFNAAVKELDSTDVDAPEIKFSLAEMSKNFKLSMKQIYPLMDFISEDE